MNLAVPILALLLLVSPTMHPWYLTLLVALLPFSPSRALAAWTAAAAIYWLHGVAMPEGVPWAEWPWATVLAHLPFVGWMLFEAFGPWRSTPVLRPHSPGGVRPDRCSVVH
jgi:hypothetical protein